MNCTRCHQPAPVIDKGLCGMCWAMGKLKPAPKLPTLPELWLPPGYEGAHWLTMKAPDLFKSEWFGDPLPGIVDDGKGKKYEWQTPKPVAGVEYTIGADMAAEPSHDDMVMAQSLAYQSAPPPNPAAKQAPKYYGTNLIQKMLQTLAPSALEMYANARQAVLRSQHGSCGECGLGVVWRQDAEGGPVRPYLCDHLFKDAENARICA